ncbi:hypothetical protein MXB_3856 [Myxobolus squamalis]|nr:hypothetical protein MXB_3856 [Myxobolus squamalis]
MSIMLTFKRTLSYLFFFDRKLIVLTSLILCVYLYKHTILSRNHFILYRLKKYVNFFDISCDDVYFNS